MNALAEANFFNRPLHRGDLGIFILAAYFIAAQPTLTQAASVNTVLSAIGHQNLFSCFAVYVASWRFLASEPAMAISRGDKYIAILAALLFAIACFCGISQMAGLVLSLLLIPLYFVGHRDDNFNSALIVCSALAINSFWGPLLFQTFTAPIIAIDTTLLKWVYSILRPDIVVNGTVFKGPDHFAIVVVGFCSVFNSASFAFLACAAMTQNLKVGIRARDGLVLIIVLLAMLTINTARLAVLGWNRSNFEFWHNGPGLSLIAIFQIIAITLIAYFGARWSLRTSKP
jgi:hypothetical protein